MSTPIEWTEETWNPVTGCTKVSAGCKNCYAETIAKRFWGDRKFTDVQCHEDRLWQPAHWRKPRKIFVNSMSDLFHENVPDHFIERIFNQMLHQQRHIYQILTKRPERMKYFLTGDIAGNIKKYLPHVWFGVSVEDQKTADERIPLLLQTPAAVRWISAEPLLGPINLPINFWIKKGEGIYQNKILDWVVVGGESGPKARPMHPDWVRSIRDQCKAAGVPFFFKQWGEFGPYKDKKNILIKIGKKNAGNLLDGEQYQEYPKMEGF